MIRHLVDTNVFVYARGAAHPYREPCRAVIGAAGSGGIRLEASVELIQELTHLLLCRGVDRAEALTEVTEVRSLCALHPFDTDVLDVATELLDRHSELRTRDAFHAATALVAGLGTVVSTDRALDPLAGIQRLDPADLAAELES